MDDNYTGQSNAVNRWRTRECIPRAEKKNWGPNLQGKVVSAPPQAEQESHVLGDLEGRSG